MKNENRQQHPGGEFAALAGYTPSILNGACDQSSAGAGSGRSLRLSIASTYDHRKTGDRYSVSSRLGGETICDRKPIADPFVRHRVIVHWWDAIKCILRHGNITVEVSVDGDDAIMEDVLELDENYIGHGSTRRAEFRAGIERALSEVGAEEREGDDA